MGQEKAKQIGIILVLLGCFFIGAESVWAQSFGASSQQYVNSDNTADKNMRGSARVNPTSLAMEFSLPFMSYPGRNGNSLPIGLSYSSKVWRMDDQFNYWYPLPYSCNRQYVSNLTPKYGERSISGWTSSLSPPIIEEKTEAFTAQGKPFNLELSENALNNLFTELIENYERITNGAIQNPNLPCGWVCVRRQDTPEGPGPCEQMDYNVCFPSGGGIEPGGGCNNNPPQQIDLYAIKRVNIRMPDGSTMEFRESDDKIPCGNSNLGCDYNKDGIYLAVDGSRARLERTSTGSNPGSVLHLPNGSRYIFPATEQHTGDDGVHLFYANEYIDGDGNITKFGETTQDNRFYVNKTDTLGRTVSDPLPQNIGMTSQKVESQSVALDGLGGGTQNFQLVWKRLKPHDCEDSTSASCGGGDGALENQAERLYFDAGQTCLGSQYTTINDGNPNTNEYLFPTNGIGLRSCSSFAFLPDGNGNVTATPNRFNPIVLAGIILPNNQQYQFKYNVYGEITKIIYPTGAYEKFEYGYVQPVANFADPAYSQTNRGVKKRWVYSSSTATAPDQYWQYSAGVENGKYSVKTTASKGDSTSQEGMKTERILNYATTVGADFGFQSPLIGLPTNEIAKDENGQIRSRTLTDWTWTGAVSGNPSFPVYGDAKRDVRPLKTISIFIEDNGAEGFKALAVKSENVYQNPATDIGVPSDA
ncbi:MAG TPA: hypothetical protein PKE69_24930, partial [Pyrinomonadaceae bacterium]|nr:hypothetical protein [Pyrinomonadaceae bacterium]